LIVDTRKPRLVNSASNDTSDVVLPLPLHPFTPKNFMPAHRSGAAARLPPDLPAG
jgi:hypothetical protein